MRTDFDRNAHRTDLIFTQAEIDKAKSASRRDEKSSVTAASANSSNEGSHQDDATHRRTMDTETAKDPFHSDGTAGRMLTRLVALIILVGAVAAFSFFVWPTSYEYGHSQGNFWRLNRWTGVREQSTGEGWKTDKDLHEAENQKALAAKLDEEKQQQLDDSKSEALAKTQELKSIEVGSTVQATAHCSMKYVDAALHFKIELTGKLGFFDKLRDLPDGYGRYLRAKFTDLDGFTVGEESVYLRSFVKRGDGYSATAESSISMDEADYLRITSWDPVYNW